MMPTIRVKVVSLAAGALLAGTALTPAYAQDGQKDAEKTADQPSADQQPASQSQGGNAIVVTGLRRSEQLQDTPASISAFNSETIQNAGIKNPADFVNLTPNVNLVQTQNAGTTFVVVRGIGQARNSEPSVAVVIDGVQQVNPSAFNQDLFDIQQIEVLKGPQGALYGRNAIGGAIIITTKQPSDYLEGNVTVGATNGFGFYTHGTVSGPLSDMVKFRLAGYYKNDQGHIQNTYLNEKADPVKDFALRGKLLFDLGGGWNLDLRGSMDHLRTRAFWYNIAPDFNVNNVSLPVQVNNRGIDNRDIYNVSAKLSYDGDAVKVTSISSYDTLSEIMTGDSYDFLPITQSYCYNTPDAYGGCYDGMRDENQSQYLDVKAFSQELRFESPTADPLFWMFGGYLISTDRFISTGNMVDLGKGVFPVYHDPSTNPDNPQQTFLSDQQNNFAWAAFANLGYQFSDMFRIDASLRYDHDHRKNTTETPQTPYDFLQTINYYVYLLNDLQNYPYAAYGQVRTKDFSDWQPKVTLTFTPTKDLTFYAGYSRGFRSGGFNQTGVGAAAATYYAGPILGVGDIFKANTADTFEAGFKTQFFDGMLTINGSAYTTLTHNSYFFVYIATNSTQNLGNVAKGRIKGLELETRLAPTDDFMVDFAWGLTDGKIKDFADPSAIGNELPLITRSTINITAQYTPDLGNGFTGLLRADYRRIGRTWWDPYNTTVRDPVSLINARAGFTKDNFSLTAFATNLLNKQYNAEYSPGGFLFKAQPRVFGVEAGYHF